LLVIVVDICWYLLRGQHLLIVVHICWYLLVFIDICWSICWYLLVFVRICCYLLASVG